MPLVIDDSSVFMDAAVTLNLAIPTIVKHVVSVLEVLESVNDTCKVCRTRSIIGVGAMHHC